MIWLVVFTIAFGPFILVPTLDAVERWIEEKRREKDYGEHG